jgi:quercetin dioxygenase-like cupin family protein
MNGRFIVSDDVKREVLDWGTLGWVCQPANAGAAQITFLEVAMNPGGGHNFHKHPDQEELIFVKTGQVEQWMEDRKQILGPGDSVFIPADLVHASFNMGAETAELLVVLGPCVGESGYEVVEVADQEPWASLR